MTVRLARGVVFTETDEQAILTGAGRGAAYYRLNQAGSKMLRLLLSGRSEKSVAEEVARDYQVDVDRVHGDLNNLLSSLRDARLVDPK